MTKRERLVLIAGLVLASAALLTRQGLPRAYLRASTFLDEHRARRALLDETQTLLRSLPVLEDSAQVLTGRMGALAPRILSGGTAAEAVADLSGRLSLLASRQGSRLETVRAVPETDPPKDLSEVAVVVTLHTDAPGLARWLGAVAVQPVVLVARKFRLAAPGGFAADAEMESLQVEMTVSGWFLPRVARN